VKSDHPVAQSVFAKSDPGEIEVDVLAKRKDPDQEVPHLKVVQTIGQIVTGTVAVANIEDVFNHQNVVRLERATQLRPELAFSVPEIRANTTQLPAWLPDGTHVDGSDDIVGIIDYGCDFLHHNFRKVDGTTRLLYLWVQRAELTGSLPGGYQRSCGRSWRSRYSVLSPDRGGREGSRIDGRPCRFRCSP
jgi:hypothetical protein